MSTTERLIYLPLGGAGEIGMNAYVYGYGEAGREKLIVVDLGVTFPDMKPLRCGFNLSRYFLAGSASTRY